MTTNTAESNSIYPVRWQDNKVWLIDQTRLPMEYGEVEITSSEAMARAIETMIVRGAPAIGVAAAYGMVLGAQEIKTNQKEQFLADLTRIADRLAQTRPTAVNLFWAIERMLKVARESGGTALGVIRSAWTAGRLIQVYADETRPRLQGAKLTAWECLREGIPVTVITDSMAAHCMQQKLIDAVIVGADRIAANGDTANKIGTYSLAVLAKAHNLPFYVAAPLSTVDFSLKDGTGIPIEQRDRAEIYQVGTTTVCPRDVNFYNPAFDVTPAALITAIITEKGAVTPAELIFLQDS